ncbi:MAG: ribosomal protein S18-alanine N-acetyltransferase [Candidatus Izemoplasma sp.]
MSLIISKMDMSDIEFVYNEEVKVFGKSLGIKTLYNEILYNDLAFYYVAYFAGKRVGYIGSWLTIPNAEILNLITIEEYRNQGIGKALLTEVIKLCVDNAIEKLSLEVRVSNSIAISFYKGFGFYVGTIRKNYYENKEDAYLMVLDVGGSK